MSKIYLLNENQLRTIRENIMRESPDEYFKGDHIMLQQVIDGFNVPANSEGIVLHVDAAGTVRTEFIVHGKPIVVPINPDVDQIIKIDPAWKESMAKIKPDPLWGDVKKLGEGEQFSIPPAAFAPKDPSIVMQLINAAKRDGYLDSPTAKAGSDANFVVAAAKKVGAEFEALPHEARVTSAKVYYKKFLNLIGYKIGDNVQPINETVSSPLSLVSQNRSNKTYSMSVKDDEFIHFTIKSHLMDIINQKRLDSSLRSELFTSTFAISTVYGKFVPNTQLFAGGGRKKDGTEFVAIKFKTNTPPEYGYVEEVVWHKPIELKSMSIMSVESAAALLKNTPYQIGEQDEVTYAKTRKIN